MLTKIQKWGNSLAIRIPRAFVREVHVSEGISVNLTIDDGKIVIDPSVGHEYRLDDLLKDVTKENLHTEVDSGEATGRETW